MPLFHRLFAALIAFSPLWLALPALAVAEGDPPVRPPTHEIVQALDLTSSWIGFTAIGIFVISYALVMAEEFLHLKKSKPMMIAAGLIWVLIGLGYAWAGDSHTAHDAVLHNLMEFGELFLFLLAAMTFVNTIEERGVFDKLRSFLVGRGFSLRQLFWVTGLLAFFMSPIADNLTTALIMGAVVMAVGVGNPAFVAVGCINIVVAANAGGAFSPFGDITTLMVWQKGIVSFGEFFALFLPSLVNWLIPAALMTMAIGKGKPEPISERVVVQKGGYVVVGLFILTIAFAVSFHNFLHLPPVLGMMTGLGVLKVYGYFMQRVYDPNEHALNEPDDVFAQPQLRDARQAKGPFDPFKQLERSEWDTLMFFYGVILAVGGLGQIGYLTLASGAMYGVLGPTYANVLVGVLSAIVDNIPVMFAVLSMQPEMSHGHWLLVTLTAGVGGSMLSIGSAAGVALMGQARGIYTFFSHLKWIWAIALGYAASILCHLWLNARMF